MDSMHVEISGLAPGEPHGTRGPTVQSEVTGSMSVRGSEMFSVYQTIRNMWTNITINAITLNNPLHFASVFIKHYYPCLRWIIVKVNILTRPLIKLYGAIHLLAPQFHPLWNGIIFITVYLVATVCCCYCGEMIHNKVQLPTAWSLSTVIDRIQNALPKMQTPKLDTWCV